MRPKLCFVVSVPSTAVAFLNGHIDYLSDTYDITVVCNFNGSERGVSKKAALHNLRIERKLSPWRDLRAVISLHRFLRQERFTIVHSVSPKAGLITAIAGWFAKVPIRIHWFTGQVWVLLAGPQRVFLRTLDSLISRLTTSVLVDSPSQREFLIDEGVVTRSKSKVLGNGSIAGVDTQRFRPNSGVRKRIRAELNIPETDSAVILFVGRLNKDKGIDTLLDAFCDASIPDNSFLVLVGPDEDGYISRIPTILDTKIDKFRYVAETSHPEEYMAASDIFCFPSLREGFGLVAIEASATELPVIASNIYGITDAVADNVTGLLFQANNATSLTIALREVLVNESLATRLGQGGRAMVIEKWGKNDLERELADYYGSLRSRTWE